MLVETAGFRIIVTAWDGSKNHLGNIYNEVGMDLNHVCFYISNISIYLVLEDHIISYTTFFWGGGTSIHHKTAVTCAWFLTTMEPGGACAFGGDDTVTPGEEVLISQGFSRLTN